MCVFSFVRQKMNDERNLIFDVCVLCECETNFFFAREKTRKNTRLFSFLFFFFSHEPLFEFFFSNIKRRCLKCSKFLTQGIYLLVQETNALPL